MTSYAETGVNIEAGDKFVNIIKNLCKPTYNNFVIDAVGGFCSLYALPNSSSLLVASTDGVGTKLLLSKQFKEYGSLQTIGIDLVAMVVNDIITSGATPLFFLDYYGLGKLDQDFKYSQDIIQGIVHGCQLANCALIGGQVSEMPALYTDDKFDIVGFGVGIVDKAKLLSKKKVIAGDIIIGIASNGVHSNGYSLVRHAYKDVDWEDTKNDYYREQLIHPTEIYVSLMHHINTSEHIHAAAQIKGGGLEHNISRVIPENLKIHINWDSWIRPEIFYDIQRRAIVEEEEMRKVFNCGIGFAVIVSKYAAKHILDSITNFGYTAWQIGVVDYNENI